jgi:hypothetical protein
LDVRERWPVIPGPDTPGARAARPNLMQARLGALAETEPPVETEAPVPALAEAARREVGARSEAVGDAAVAREAAAALARLVEAAGVPPGRVAVPTTRIARRQKNA